MPGAITRFGASVETDLLAQFDSLVKRKGYSTRSEVLGDLMREYIVANGDDPGSGTAIGAITLVYDHHAADLSEKLNQAQHDFHDCVLSALHVHLDAHTCLEVVVVRGHGKLLEGLADRLISARGVLHGRLVVTSTEELLRIRHPGDDLGCAIDPSEQHSHQARGE